MEPPDLEQSKAWIHVQREGGRRKSLQYNGPFAFVSGVVLTIAWFVPYPDAVFNMCLLKRMAAVPCAFCGSSRSFAAMIHGDWGWAFVNSPMAAVLFLLTVLMFVVCIAAIAAGVRLHPGGRLRHLFRRPLRWLGLGVLVVLLNWWYRLNCL